MRTAWKDRTVGFRAIKPNRANENSLTQEGTNVFVRRDEKGRFDEVVDVGRSLGQDTRREAKTKVPPGQGDRGDQNREGSLKREAESTLNRGIS